MRSLQLLFVLSCSFAVAFGQMQCEHRKPNIPTEWIDMVSPCIRAMRDQVQAELNASMQYLAMGAYFSRDSVNRPGFAKLFFDSASEERDHAIKLISYLLMRGELTTGVSDLIKTTLIPPVSVWDNGIHALKDALKLEAKVTKLIRNVIKECENPASQGNNLAGQDFNDYHLVDYLTGDFLEEQYKGQRELAGKVSTLDKMMDKHGALGEWLYDKKLLNGE